MSSESDYAALLRRLATGTVSAYEPGIEEALAPWHATAIGGRYYVWPPSIPGAGTDPIVLITIPDSRVLAPGSRVPVGDSSDSPAEYVPNPDAKYRVDFIPSLSRLQAINGADGPNMAMLAAFATAAIGVPALTESLGAGTDALMGFGGVGAEEIVPLESITGGPSVGMLDTYDFATGQWVAPYDPLIGFDSLAPNIALTPIDDIVTSVTTSAVPASSSISDIFGNIAESIKTGAKAVTDSARAISTLRTALGATPQQTRPQGRAVATLAKTDLLPLVVLGGLAYITTR